MLPKHTPRGKFRGLAMESRRRESSFSYDRGTVRKGRREHWRPVQIDPVEVSLLRRKDAANLDSIDGFRLDAEAIGTDAA